MLSCTYSNQECESDETVERCFDCREPVCQAHSTEIDLDTTGKGHKHFVRVCAECLDKRYLAEQEHTPINPAAIRQLMNPAMFGGEWL